MRAEVKRFHSPDIYDLASYDPIEKDCFGFLLQVMVGPVGEEAEESFDIVVATPAWLSEHHRPEDIVVGRHHLIVFRYDFSALSRFIRGYVSRCEGDTWEEIALKLSRLGQWEFEDYHPCQSE